MRMERYRHMPQKDFEKETPTIKLQPQSSDCGWSFITYGKTLHLRHAAHRINEVQQIGSKELD